MTVLLRDLKKTFADGTEAVKNIDLDIPQGEFITLLGPSGCGKTTTLRLIAGLEEPTAGTISINDRDVTNIDPGDRDIAMVFQSYALYPHMTALEKHDAEPHRARYDESPPQLSGPEKRPNCLTSRNCCIASQRNSRAGNVSAWRWGARWCVTRCAI